MIIKLAAITIPDSHLKEDHKELEGMKHQAKKILKTTKEMEDEDKEAKKKYGMKR